MARLHGSFQFTGGLSNISAYKMRGVDRIIVRSKGGASRKMIQKSENFVRTRELNLEWTGCTRAGRSVRVAIRPLNRMADYNFSGPLNALMKVIQKLDLENVSGERSVEISRHKDLLNGFSLNIQNTWDNMIKSTVTYTLDRSSGKATVNFPALIPGINFQNRSKRPFFRFVVVLGVVSDMAFSGDYMKYRHLDPLAEKNSVFAESEWSSALARFDGLRLEVALDQNYTPDTTDTLILGVGFEYGNPVGNIIEPVKYSGSAKILVTG